MAFTLPTSIPLGSKSRARHTTIYSGVDEFNNDNNSRYRRRYNDNDLRVSTEQVEWGQYNSFIRYIRWLSSFRFDLRIDNRWFRLLSRNYNKSSKSGTRSTRNRKNYRNYCYYYIALCLLAITPAYAEPEVQNTSNPVAAATGNVTNQAVQFQNNGAPSRQIMGPNISCNGSTMTFSPFYMGNHTTPYDDTMTQSSYTVAENWGFQVNFMVPLDKRGSERCRRMAARQEEKMRLDYELVRALKCAELQTKGFMIHPKSQLYSLCADIVPIASYLKSTQPPIPKEKPWYNPF